MLFKPRSARMRKAHYYPRQGREEAMVAFKSHTEMVLSHMNLILITESHCPWVIS